MSRSRNKYPIERIGFVCAEDKNTANKKERIVTKQFLKKEFDRFDEIPIPCEEELRNNRSNLKRCADKMGKCWDKEFDEETFRK